MPLYGDGKRIKISTDDSVPDFLESKIVAGDSVSITKEGAGVNEQLRIAAIVTQVFSTDYQTSLVLVTTSSTSPQDAFAGASLSPPVDGDYIVFYEADMRVTNNNGVMALSLGLNSTTTEIAGSLRAFEGNDRGSNIVIWPLPGLTTSDTIHGLFRKFSGSGTAQIRNRSMLLMRIG